MKFKSLLICLLISKFIYSQSSNKVDSRIDLLVDYIGLVYEGLDFSNFIYIGINRQKLYYVKEDSLINIYDVSTALNGAGNTLQSFKTPIGLHEISEKIGNDMPIGASFKHKHYTGQVLEILLDSSSNDSINDAITTRILTLKGLEKGLNVGSYKFDTKNRGIYIHGTTEEGLIGKPASHGCIRMRNTEVIELFNAVNVGCKVVILDN